MSQSIALLEAPLQRAEYVWRYNIWRFGFGLVVKIGESVKSRKPDGTVKSFRCKARKSDGMRRTYLYAAMTEDAAQRRRWTFYEAVKIHFKNFATI